ncbi:histidine phosphatase family protein [Virgibacillus byunsanensis]|uniref:phosphoglycerate mutase (2,3-diphosphoglycerate-dependent) n=1 Tax=Virgibacillus byunsanensis TaxID=570945 RepID=A0ABW3LQ76_9BACI
MKEILIMRHGESVADIENRLEGKADFALTDLGVRQAEITSQWINKHYNLDLIIASTLKRASKTAQILAIETGAKLQFDERLKEMDNGVLAGLLKTEADIKYPFPEDGRNYDEPIPGGESILLFQQRVETFWNRLIQRLFANNELDRICLVAHGKTIAMLFRCFLKLPPESNFWVATGDTGVHLLRFTTEERLIVFSNYEPAKHK